MANTMIEFPYRDASNYKIWTECIIKGEFTKDHQERIRAAVDFEGFYIPEIVGLPCNRFSEETNDDHPWIAFEDTIFTETDSEPTIDLTVEDLVSRFQAVGTNGWFRWF